MNQAIQMRFVSPEGYQSMLGRLDDLRTRHKEICDQRTIAHELSGDGWHDNPHFNYLQQMEAESTRKIADLEAVLVHLRIYQVEEGQRPTDRVRLGSIVEIAIMDMNSGREEERIIEIVGHQESDQEGLRVAYDAPFGAALIGVEEGDRVEIQLPRGKLEVEILALHPDRSTAGLDH